MKWLGFGAGLGLLWVLPWTEWLAPFPWVRIGLGVMLFMVPGVLASMLLVEERFTLATHLSSGVVLSAFLVGGLGLLGKILNLPFAYLKPTFVVFSLASLFLVYLRARRGLKLYKSKSYSTLTLVLFLVMAGVGILTSLQDRFGGDDLSYLAYLTNWQHAGRLGFTDIIFGSGAIGHIRFWLAMLPMDFAFLADISQLHGLLLLGIYLEPILILLALLAAYGLYEDLLGFEARAIVALSLQIACFFLLFAHLQAGRAFFLRLTEDKAFAAFIQAPIFFLALRAFLETYSWRRGLLVLLSGWSIALIHPIILAYTVFIGGLWAFLVLMNSREFKKLAMVVALMAAIIAPPSPLRFIEMAGVGPRGAFDLEQAQKTAGIKDRITTVAGTPYYGFNLKRVQISGLAADKSNAVAIFFSWSMVWLAVLSLIWSVLNIKKHPAAAYVAAAGVLFVVSAFPYTGWLVGKVVAARMLWRVPWMFPWGVAVTLLISQPVAWIWHRGWGSNAMSGTLSQATVGFACLLLIIGLGVSTNRPQLTLILDRKGYENSLETFASLGAFLETHIDKPAIFVAPAAFRDYLPGICSKCKLIYFRKPGFAATLGAPEVVDPEDLKLILSTDQSFSILQRTRLLNRYHVRYILTNNVSLRDYYSMQPDFGNLQQTADFWIIEYQSPAGW